MPLLLGGIGDDDDNALAGGYDTIKIFKNTCKLTSLVYGIYPDHPPRLDVIKYSKDGVGGLVE